MGDKGRREGREGKGEEKGKDSWGRVRNVEEKGKDRRDLEAKGMGKGREG